MRGTGEDLKHGGFVSGVSSRGTYHRRSVAGASNATPLLLLMGYSGSVDGWTEPFLARLAKERPVVALDLPGNGRATRKLEPGRLAYAEVVRDIDETMTELGLTQAHVLGYSYGGTVAMSLAKALPERVSSLTLVATTLGGARYTPPPAAQLRALAAPPGESLEEKCEVIWRVCLGADRMDQHRTALQEILARQYDNMTPGSVLRQQLANYVAFDFAAEARAMQLPVCVVTGDEDPLTPRENALAIAMAFHGAELHEFAGCRHMPHLEEPELFATTLLDFAARHEP